MHIFIGVLYAIGAVCELLGVVLVAWFACRLRRVLRTGALGRIDAGDASGQRTEPDLDNVVGLLAEDAARPWVAAGLLVTGVLAEAVANFLSL